MGGSFEVARSIADSAFGTPQSLSVRCFQPSTFHTNLPVSTAVVLHCFAAAAGLATHHDWLVMDYSASHHDGELLADSWIATALRAGSAACFATELVAAGCLSGLAMELLAATGFASELRAAAWLATAALRATHVSYS